MARDRFQTRRTGVDALLLDDGPDARGIAERISSLPEEFQPFFNDFREYIKDEATAYVKSTPRPKSQRQFKEYVAGFLTRIAVPLGLMQQAVVAAAYRWPLPHAEAVTKVGSGLVSAGTAAYGQSIAYGSAFAASAGALTTGVSGEILELYAVASARTSSYRWAGIHPGEKVIADDLAQIMGSKHLLAAGTTRHIGDEYLTALLDLLERAVVLNVVLLFVGPVRAGYRSFRNVDRAYNTPLTKVATDENRPPPKTAFPVFGELLARLQDGHRLPPGLGYTPA